MKIIHNRNGTGVTLCIHCGSIAATGLTDDVFCDECKELPYKEVEGDLVTGALTGYFDVVAHGCNCFSTMRAGIAPQMARAFGCDKFELEGDEYFGSREKLGTMDYQDVEIAIKENDTTTVSVANLYTQYRYNRKGEDTVQLDYDALEKCLEELSMAFDGEHIGLPMIGCGKARGNWQFVKTMIQGKLKNCKVTIVKYKP